MRRMIVGMGLIASCVWLVASVQRTAAFPAKARETKAACAACHVNVAGGADLTETGKKYKADPKTAVPTDIKGAEYVGTNKCKMCHSKEFKGWQTTKHGMAWAGLVKADPKAAADLAAKLGVEIKGKPETTDGCVGCHVTGFQLPGGYPAADSAKTASLINMGCENCHGPGSKHIAAAKEERKKFINKQVSAAFCQQCHTAVTSPNFDFEAYKKKGLHSMAAEAAPAK